MNNNAIRIKIEEWLDYIENSPKQNQDLYRQEHDLDCLLTGGNLFADTIFSLWLPLRFALVRLNGYEKLEVYGKVGKNVPFLKNLLKNHILDELLPLSNPLVIHLNELFTLGRTRANVMILPLRQLNSKRGWMPYFDYMPHFLYECFEGGKFSYAFDYDNPTFIQWVEREHLTPFFNQTISKESIKDLANTGSLKKGVPQDLDSLILNYIDILKQRHILLEQKPCS